MFDGAVTGQVIVKIVHNIEHQIFGPHGIHFVPSTFGPAAGGELGSVLEFVGGSNFGRAQNITLRVVIGWKTLESIVHDDAS